MAYSIPDDVRLVLQGHKETGDQDRTAARLSDEQIGYEIENADAHIDAALRRRYVTPLPDPVPRIIKNLSIDIAVALSDMIYRGSREYASGLNPIRLRYERALLMLDRIAAGDYPIYNEGENPAPLGVGTASVFNIQPSLFDLRDVFPRGRVDSNGGADAEYSETVSYYPDGRSSY